MSDDLDADKLGLKSELEFLRSLAQILAPLDGGAPDVPRALDAISTMRMVLSRAPRPENGAADETLERMVEAYTSYQSSADRGLAQQMEGMRLALAAAGQRAETEPPTDFRGRSVSNNTSAATRAEVESTQWTPTADEISYAKDIVAADGFYTGAAVVVAKALLRLSGPNSP